MIYFFSYLEREPHPSTSIQFYSELTPPQVNPWQMVLYCLSEMHRSSDRCIFLLEIKNSRFKIIVPRETKPRNHILRFRGLIIYYFLDFLASFFASFSAFILALRASSSLFFLAASASFLATAASCLDLEISY